MKFLPALLVLLLSGCDPEYRVIHQSFVLADQCLFEKFTEEEKSTITDSVGQKIYRNQDNCRLRHIRNLDNVKNHNKAHVDGEK